jgi:hypothetical protein
VATPSNLNAVRQAYNTRFGIYQGTYTVDNATPDYTGYAYPTTSSASPRVTRGPAYAAYQARRSAYAAFSSGDYAGGTPPGTVFNPASNTAKAGQRRLITMAVVNCPWQANNVVRDLACVLMLNPMDNGSEPEVWFEYLGSASSAGSPCGPTVGMPGGGPAVPTLVQ